MSHKQSAFEIRFSQTDSRLEVFEIQPDLDQERIPEPFKKRDKIPRYSTIPEQYGISNNSNVKSRHSLNDEKVISTNSNGIDKVKSSNAVRPEADKQQQRVLKNSNLERVNSDSSTKNALDDEPIIRNGVQSSNKKQRVEESAGERDKGNLSKGIIPNHQIMDLNGKTEMVVSGNKKIKQKSIRKNKKITNNNKDEENKPLPKDGIATPPATPPRSPQVTPDISQTHSNDGIPFDQSKLEESQQLVTPPPSSDSSNFNDDVSIPQSSRKRRESQSSQKSQTRSNEIDTSQESQSRVRRLSSTSQQLQQAMTRSRIPRLSISSKERPIISKKISKESLSSLSSNKSNGFNESSESDFSAISKLQPPRVLRLSTSRPIINTFTSDMEIESESPTSYSLPSYSPPSHSPTSHSPMSQSPMSQSPMSQSPISQSPTSQSPTSSSVLQKKPIIPYDEIIVPTVAKKLKMNGQLHFTNHDALLGYSEEPENMSQTTENGYMDITDQVTDLFDVPQNKSHKKRQSIPDSRRLRQQSARKKSSSGHSRSQSKTHYIAPRKQNHNQQAQKTFEEPPSPISTQFENPPSPSTFIDDDFNKRRKSRREEYIMVVRDDDDDDDDAEFTEPLPPMPYFPPEPFTAPTVQVEINDQTYDKVEEPFPVQMPVQMSIQMPTQMPVQVPVQVPAQMPVMQTMGYNPNFEEATYAPVVTSDKRKKNKKKQEKDFEDDNYVRKSKCCCTIQ